MKLGVTFYHFSAPTHPCLHYENNNNTNLLYKVIKDDRKITLSFREFKEFYNC